MRKLLNYSIETDNLILLEFNDGQNLRVAIDQVSDHLAGSDLAKVSRALKLRRDFIRHNFPKTLVVAAIVGLAAFAMVDSKRVANFWHGLHPLHPAPTHAGGAAHALSTPTPTPTPSATPEAPHETPSAAQPIATPKTAVPAVPRLQATPSLQGAPLPVKPLEDELEDALKSTLNLTSKLGHN